MWVDTIRSSGRPAIDRVHRVAVPDRRARRDPRRGRPSARGSRRRRGRRSRRRPSAGSGNRRRTARRPRRGRRRRGRPRTGRGRGTTSRSITFGPPIRLAMPGPGIVIFGIAVVAASARNVKASMKIGWSRWTLPTTIGIGGLSPSPEKSFGRSRWAVPIPPSAARKSRCHQSRRNSPSVTAGRPTASSLATSSVIASSSIGRNSSAVSRPSRHSARASASRFGRSRLPTMSA